jgi:hypothetical protein
MNHAEGFRKVEVLPLSEANGEPESLAPVGFSETRQVWGMRAVVGGFICLVWMPREYLDDAQHANLLVQVESHRKEMEASLAKAEQDPEVAEFIKEMKKFNANKEQYD